MTRRLTERAVSKGTLIWILVLAGFVIFLACFKWSDSEPSKIYRTDLFIVWTCVSAAGTLLTWLLVTQIKKHGKQLFTVFLFLFCVGTLGGTLFLYQMANGEDAYGLHDRIETSANFNVNTTAYRFSNTDNPETLTHGFMASANFCRVAPTWSSGRRTTRRKLLRCSFRSTANWLPHWAP